jgi:hypothetical protein
MNNFFIENLPILYFFLMGLFVVIYSALISGDIKFKK